MGLFLSFYQLIHLRCCLKFLKGQYILVGLKKKKETWIVECFQIKTYLKFSSLPSNTQSDGPFESVLINR